MGSLGLSQVRVIEVRVVLLIKGAGQPEGSAAYKYNHLFSLSLVMLEEDIFLSWRTWSGKAQGELIHVPVLPIPMPSYLFVPVGI